MYMEKRNLTMQLIANKAVQAGWARVRPRSAPATTAKPRLSHQKEPRQVTGPVCQLLSCRHFTYPRKSLWSR